LVDAFCIANRLPGAKNKRFKRSAINVIEINLEEYLMNKYRDNYLKNVE
jgi:hypothetical protein